jgi:hypothetical protein
MKPKWSPLALLVGLFAVLSSYTAEAQSPAQPAPAEYAETFDARPPQPRPSVIGEWDIVANVSDAWLGGDIEPMEAHHGDDCGPPPATHRITSIDQGVFLCRDHLMTAVSAGYGYIVLTPNQFVDFSTGETVVSFDMSTLRGSGRDWVDLWITPFADNLLLPLEEWLPAYNGEPRNAIHIRMDNGNLGTFFEARIIRDHEAQPLPLADDRGYEEVLTPSAVTRSTFELRISGTHLKFGMPAQNLWWADATIAGLGWSKGILQIGHHAYNPTKDCDDVNGCYNTWHWDNVKISQASPFTVIRGTQQVASPSTTQTITFPQAAPQNAYLRFAAVGSNLRISTNGGQSWVSARRQPQEKDKAEHFSSYFTPIPAGTTSVKVAGDSFWGGAWHMRHFAIWAADDESVQAPVRPAAAAQPAAVAGHAHGAAQAPAAISTDGKVTFDDAPGQDRALDGEFPTGLIDWGTGSWWLAAPWGKLTTRSISFNGPEHTSATFTIVQPRRLLRLDAYNGGNESTVVTLSCGDETPVERKLDAGELASIETGWRRACAQITLSTGNGWDTNFDNLLFDTGETAAAAAPVDGSATTAGDGGVSVRVELVAAGAALGALGMLAVLCTHRRWLPHRHG